MAKRIFKIEGLRELIDGLNDLPKATSTNVQKRALMKAADPIEEQAQALAPVRTGKLQRSFKTSTRHWRQAKKESKVELYVGPAQLVQAIQNEFGNVHQSAQPFMRPAWDANKLGAVGSIREDLADEIQKAAARIARKTARLAAKTRP